MHVAITHSQTLEKDSFFCVMHYVIQVLLLSFHKSPSCSLTQPISPHLKNHFYSKHRMLKAMFPARTLCLTRKFSSHHKQDYPDFFCKSNTGSFIQDRPVISNPFSSDKFLQRYLTRLLPESVSFMVFVIYTDMVTNVHNMVLTWNFIYR